MKRLLIGLTTGGAVLALTLIATNAFFSDVETSTGNTFTAGKLDLQVDYEGYYNQAVNGQPNAGSWELKDLTQAEKFFDFADVKPGDYGEGTISLHVTDNNAWSCVTITPTLNDDVSSTDPELAVGDVANTDSIFDGELAQNMQFRIWADVCAIAPAVPGDNIYQGDGDCDKLLTSGTSPVTPVSWALADSTHPNVFTGQIEPLVGTQTYYLGADWKILDTVGNIIQSDKYMADISFSVEQFRNNPNFVCNVPTQGQSLRLENERQVTGAPWEIIVDGTYADLTWPGNGPTFDYSLTGHGLTPNTGYSLIYYADGWPGNNPGAFIGNGTSDGTGNIAFSGTPNLGVDLPTLPDGNFATGAKIWLVLTSDYNSGALSTGPMTVWQPDKYLFEGNVYIHYNDTNN